RAGKITVNRDNFKDSFNQNGSAKDNYDQLTGIQTITNGSFQSGNISFNGSIDVRNNFEIDGAINLGQITSNYGYTGIADGIGFVFYKGERNQVGGNGGDLGIYGVTNAFGWKVDTWFNQHTAYNQILKGDYDDGHHNPYGAFITTNKTGYGSIDQQSAKNLTRSIEDNKFHDVKFIYTANTKEFKIVLSTPGGDVPFSKTFDYDETSPAYYFTIAASTGILPTNQAFRIDSMTYSPIQKAIINYVDDTTGRTIASDSVTGNSEKTIDYSTANKISGFQKNGYELVNDGFSKGATYDHDDTVDQKFTVHLKHKLTPVNPKDSQTPGAPINQDEPDGPKWPTSTNYDKTVNETVSYVDQNGHVVAKPHTDSVNFTRTVVVDNVTGDVTTSGAGTTAWTATNGDTTFDAVVSPVVPGSVADKAQTAAVTDLNADSADVKETVTYTKVGSLVPSSSDVNFPGAAKVVYPNDSSDATKVTPAGVPTVPGYTAHDPEGHVLTPGSSYQPSDPTKDTKITYTADKQKGSVSYVDDTTGKTLKTDSISGPTGSKFSYSTSGNIADYKKHGYELVTDGYPADLTLDNNDTTDQNFTVHLKHQNIQSTEVKTVTETIHYQGAGNQTPADNTAQVTFTRQVSTDAVTGEKAYGSWSADQSFAAVKSPEVKGYTAAKPQIDKQTVNGDSKDLAFTVTYTKTPVAGGNVTAKYVDENGNPIAYDVIASGNVGDPYSTTQKDVPGYTFKEVQGNPTGSFTDQDQTVTYVYTKNPATDNNGGTGLNQPGKPGNGTDTGNSSSNQPGNPSQPSNATNNGVINTSTNTGSKVNNGAVNSPELPQTGENNSQSQTMSFIGILLAMFGSSIGIKKRRDD
ncbi:lectin-like domain-containing protein, partial [Lactobacillus helveticus]|uniref:lectin-like domain-containing protein n=1 Tax=Lactobacillus helveticus TaxID=1587 RepID=UPI00156310D0